MFYVHGDQGTLFGASPETAVRVEGRPKRVHVKPIAGTRPRGKTPAGEVDDDLDGATRPSYDWMRKRSLST